MGKRRDIPRPHNGGKWTSARMRSFIVSALRSASVRWGPKYAALDCAYVRTGINPRTGRKCKLHRCEGCGGLFPKGELRADHISPVIDPEVGFVSWDAYIERMFCEAGGFQALCNGCHDAKTSAEREVRSGKMPVVRHRSRGRKP